MLNGLFSPWPSYTIEEANAVNSVLMSNKVNYWTGQECRHFETEFASFVNVNYAIALANGTVALDLALLAIGVGEGDEVIVTPRTYLATVSSIVNSGATPVFADVNDVTQNITIDTITPIITKKTKAIMCVHLAGWPCDMDPIIKFAKKHKLSIIEDCAQAHGALYKGRPVGSLGDVCCWSFCQDKIMTTGGEGGMVTTNNKKMWSKMWSYKDHGKNWNKVYHKKHPPGFRWLHDTFGTNWRMTEMQAAIGRIQLKKMPKWQSTRLKNANKIWLSAKNTGVLITPDFQNLANNENEFAESRHAAYKCYVFVKGTKKLRDQIMKQINFAGVPCIAGSCPEVYLEKAFKNTSFKPSKRLKVAKKLGETSLMFLCHPTLKKDEIDKTCHVIKKVCSNLK